MPPKRAFRQPKREDQEKIVSSILGSPAVVDEKKCIQWGEDIASHKTRDIPNKVCIVVLSTHLILNCLLCRQVLWQPNSIITFKYFLPEIRNKHEITMDFSSGIRKIRKYKFACLLLNAIFISQ